VKESLFFHAAALQEIRDKVVAHLREKKEIGPADVKDLLGVSRKYAIPSWSTSTPSGSPSAKAREGAR